MQVSNNNTIIRKQYKNKLNTEMKNSPYWLASKEFEIVVSILTCALLQIDWTTICWLDMCLYMYILPCRITCHVDLDHVISGRWLSLVYHAKIYFFSLKLLQFNGYFINYHANTFFHLFECITVTKFQHFGCTLLKQIHALAILAHLKNVLCYNFCG